MMVVNNFDDAIKILPYKIRNILTCLESKIKKETYEIRLRYNRPLMLYGKYGSVFVKNDCTYSAVSYHGAIYVSESDINDSVAAVCNYSLYSKQNEILNGYLTYGNGHRIGISGEAVTFDGKTSSLKNIHSLCIRIASIKSVLPENVANILNSSFDGIVICGKPCSGKTTLLRTVAEKLSSDFINGGNKVVIIDERYELGISDDLNCDILRGYKKQEGIIHALRTLSPDIIICDEISTCEEVDKISEGFHSGVKFIVTVHISSKDDLYNRNVTKKLIDSSCFDYFVILDNGNSAGIIKDIYKLETVL